jgi:tetratricopeptide (TPR) repeat protein
MIKEAKLYHEQGLYELAKKKYGEALSFIRENENFSDPDALLQAVEERIKQVDADLGRVNEDAAPDLAKDIQGLIRNLFSFSKNEAKAASEGAAALAQFGQYEQAMCEFQRLLRQGSMRVSAAKNILKCHLAYASVEVAFAQYRQWVSRAFFSTDELAHIRDFLEGMVEKQASGKTAAGQRGQTGLGKRSGDEWLNIASVSIRLDNEKQSESLEDFEVIQQFNDIVSLLVPPDRGHLIERFKLGMHLSELRCYSEQALFTVNGTVFGKNEIMDGPRQGQYVLDITVADA